MPAKTGSNHPDHVATQSSKIAAEIEPILFKLLATYELPHTHSEDVPMVAAAAEKLATYVIDYRRNDWYEGYKQGYQAAKDGKEMTDKEAYDQLPEGHGAR